MSSTDMYNGLSCIELVTGTNYPEECYISTLILAWSNIRPRGSEKKPHKRVFLSDDARDYMASEQEETKRTQETDSTLSHDFRRHSCCNAS